MHVIRLHGPWNLEVAGDSSRRVHLPRDWKEVVEAAREHCVALVRRFHRPTGLTERTQVTLSVPAGWPVSLFTIQGQECPGRVNGERLSYDLSEVIGGREAHDLKIAFGVGDGLESQPYFVAIEIVEQEA